MISVQDLVKDFGHRRAVDHVSFEVERGEVLGFLGPNGAGKTTTMRMITGFLRPDAGTVVVGGDNVLTHPVEVKSRIGYLPEGSPSYPDMTVYDFLSWVADVRGLSGDVHQKAIERAVDRCHIGKVTHQLIGTLSKGFRQRVGFAQALIHDPEVLILDEPTDGLDPNQKHEVRNLIKNLAKEKVIVLSTHILEEVEAVCTRAIIMSSGRIVADDEPMNLLTQAARHGLLTLRIAGGQIEGLASGIEGLASDLEKVSGVEQVEERAVEGSGDHLFMVYPAKGENIQDAVAHFVKDKGLEIHELSYEKGRLDEVFRQITQSDL